MELDHIKELISAMKKAGLTKLKLKEKGGAEIELERSEYRSSEMPAHFHPHPHPNPPAQHVAPAVAPEKPSSNAGVAMGEAITSPMVGTFYTKPGPEQPAFVKVGDSVTKDTVVCIVEAMKVMNEVKAGKAGKIKNILVADSDPVEYGQALFEID